MNVLIGSWKCCRRRVVAGVLDLAELAELAAPQKTFQHALQAVRLGQVALARIVGARRGNILEMHGLSEHRADRGHLIHQPLHRHETRGELGGEEQ